MSFLPLTTVRTLILFQLLLGPVAVEGSAVGVKFMLVSSFEILFELCCFKYFFLEEQMLQRLLNTTQSMIWREYAPIANACPLKES